jgi:hypothetical protein
VWAKIAWLGVVRGGYELQCTFCRFAWEGVLDTYGCVGVILGVEKGLK